MGAVKLELRCPRVVEGIAVDPEPDWNFEDVLSELNSLESKLVASSKAPVPFTKARSRHFPNGKSLVRNSRPFVMRVVEDDMDDTESGDEKGHGKNVVAVKRFHCDELYLSDDDDFDHDTALEVQPYLMEEMGLVEGALVEETLDHQLCVKEEIRNKICSLEKSLIGENEKSTSSLLRVEKYREARRESDRKLDTQYQRKIAEALDNHLTAIQRDHELRSQIEERKISAAIEGAKRKEKALLEEKLRQEKAKAEAEAKVRAEEAKRAALEAQIKAEKEAAEREALEAANKAAGKALQDDASLSTKTSESELDKKKLVLEGEIIKAAERALTSEQDRLKKLEAVDEENKALGLTSNKEHIRLERNISKLIRQITGTRDVVRQKASDLVKILKNPLLPQSISCAAFARKVVSYCESPSSAAFACAYVIVLVTSEVPHLMDLILAELHRACIYTVPKHIVYSELAFESKNEYYKSIGFREDEGKIEDVEDYVKRVEAYMKLYGALVQTEIAGIQNPHGMKSGWAWIARFLNSLPANRYTAVALSAFLRMAGYALFKTYKSQFKKILIIVFDNFLKALEARKGPTLTSVILEIQSYIEDNKFLQEPEGRSLEGALLSSVMVPESDYERSYHGSYQGGGYRGGGYHGGGYHGGGYY